MGLGNPGRRYEKTRHNMGFRVIDELAIRWGVQLSQYKCSSRLGRTSWHGELVCLMQPQTYVNGSGKAAACLCETYQLQRTDFVVVYDDLDLPLRRLRIKRTGGSGGHGGIASIMVALAGSDFARIKMGVGRPTAELDPADFVLQPFTRDEEAFTLPAARYAATVVEAVLAEGLDRAMASINGVERMRHANPA